MRRPAPARLGRMRGLLLGGLLVLCVGALSCEQAEFGEQERREVDLVLSTGVGFSSDPYVQAETLRVLEIIGNPSLNHYAEQLVESSRAPMVRVAALRVLLANDYKDIRRVAVRRFSEADSAEKAAILEAVSEYGSPQLRRVLMARALNGDDLALRRAAFELGPVRRLRQAQADNKTAYLQNTLLPEIGQFVQDSDPLLAARALQIAVEVGQAERAEPWLAMLRDPGAPRAKRLAAAQILGRARVPEAVEIFEDMLKSARGTPTRALRVPERLDQELLRAATLGLLASGKNEVLDQARGYLDNADIPQSVEVLEALRGNDSEDAAIILKVAMQDVRPEIRNLAGELYAAHESASVSAFLEIMAQGDTDTRRQLAEELAAHFPGEWAAALAAKLEQKEGRLQVLQRLRDLSDSEGQKKVLQRLAPALTKLAAGGQQEENALAALLLLRVKDDPHTRALVASLEAPATHYAYLEHLVRSAPRENVEYFRENLRYGDLFAIRLMSAAGMLLAFEAGAAEKLEEPGEPASPGAALSAASD